MKDCMEIQKVLIHYLNGELKTSEELFIEEHLKHCEECAFQKSQLEKVLNALNMVEDVEVPLFIREQTLQLIEKENRREAVAASRNRSPLGINKILGAIGFGVVQVVLFGQFSGTFAPNQSIPPLNMVTACVLWCGLIILASLVVFGGFKETRRKFTGAVTLALVGMVAVAFLPFILAPKPFYYLWEASRWGQQFAQQFGKDGSTFFFGVLYGLIPMSIIAFFLGRKVKDKILENALLSSIVFTCLILPAIYLQSYTLFIHSSVILISWGFGALIGAFGGVWSGLGLNRLKENLVTHTNN